MDVLTAEEVGRILTYVAPRYFARLAFRAQFPQRGRVPARNPRHHGGDELVARGGCELVGGLAEHHHRADEGRLRRPGDRSLDRRRILLRAPRGWGLIRAVLGPASGSPVPAGSFRVPTGSFRVRAHAAKAAEADLAGNRGVQGRAAGGRDAEVRARALGRRVSRAVPHRSPLAER